MNDHDRNVYILGAGFSATAGIPLMKYFLDEARRLRSATFFDNFKMIFDYQDRLSPSSRIINQDIDNIEEIFGLIDLNIAVTGDPELVETRNILINMISSVIEMNDKTKARIDKGIVLRMHELGNFPVKKHNIGYMKDIHYNRMSNLTYVEIDSYLYFGGLVTGLMQDYPQCGNYYKDTVISFNYDLVLDRALDKHIIPLAIDYVLNRNYFDKIDRMCDSPQYHLPRLKLLKMHGSIGFKVCTKCGIVVADNNKIPDKCILCESDLSINSSLIIPPTWNKTEHGDYITEIWREGYKELAEARRIIIIGYSFPVTDVFFKHLLGVSLSHNKKLESLIVVDPDDKVGEKYEKMLNSNFKNRNYRYFQSEFPSVLTINGGEFQKLINRKVQ